MQVSQSCKIYIIYNVTNTTVILKCFCINITYIIITIINVIITNINYFKQFRPIAYNKFHNRFQDDTFLVLENRRAT